MKYIEAYLQLQVSENAHRRHAHFYAYVLHVFCREYTLTCHCDMMPPSNTPGLHFVAFFNAFLYRTTNASYAFWAFVGSRRDDDYRRC